MSSGITSRALQYYRTGDFFMVWDGNRRSWVLFWRGEDFNADLNGKIKPRGDHRILVACKMLAVSLGTKSPS